MVHGTYASSEAIQEKISSIAPLLEYALLSHTSSAIASRREASHLPAIRPAADWICNCIIRRTIIPHVPKLNFVRRKDGGQRHPTDIHYREQVFRAQVRQPGGAGAEGRQRGHYVHAKAGLARHGGDRGAIR